jgi:hypothetical protein
MPVNGDFIPKKRLFVNLPTCHRERSEAISQRAARIAIQEGGAYLAS